MAFRHAGQTLLGCIVAMGISVAAATTAVPAQQVSALLKVGTGRVSIAGTSNIHAFTASTSTVQLTRVKLATSVAAPTFWDEIVKPGAVEAFEIAIPAATLSSPKEGLDKNMHKALKVQEYPEITFRLLRLEAGQAGSLKGMGLLKIAGVEREVALDLKTQRRDSSLTVTGGLDLLMTDFGIAPPKAMLGMLKTDPKITVTFETVLTVPLT